MPGAYAIVRHCGSTEGEGPKGLSGCSAAMHAAGYAGPRVTIYHNSVEGARIYAIIEHYGTRIRGTIGLRRCARNEKIQHCPFIESPFHLYSIPHKNTPL